MKTTPRFITRRHMLKTSVALGVLASCPRVFGAETGSSNWTSTIIAFLQTLARPDGGYAWADQEESHLTPTFAAIGCFKILNQTPPNKAKLAEFVRTHHPRELKKLEQEHREFEFQQIQSLLWLGEDIAEFREQVSGWKAPTVYLKQYEQHGYPILQHEVMAFLCRRLLGMPLDDLAPRYVQYLNSRRRENGSFNNTPAADGGNGHVLNTWWGLQALDSLGRLEEKKTETIAWLNECQLANGGFAYAPKAEFGPWDDVGYTWAAVMSLKLLGAMPAKTEACVNYLHSLQNADGGFGDRAGWVSNPMATFYAMDALHALGALKVTPSLPKPVSRTRTQLPSGLKVFSIQLEAHGKGSPAEAVDLARALRIHLWGAKNALPAWIARAQAIALQQQVPVKFFAANEEYGTWVDVPGMGTYSHTSDIIAPAATDFGPALSNKGVVTWPEFRERRLAPLLKAQGRLIWQFGENEELTRIYLDDSLQRGGYAAISTFHFGNPDFTNSEPFLHRWRGQLPFVALQDSHGNEPWWFADMTTGFRTVFLATEPTWEGWLNALKQNWVVAIRHDAVSRWKTWMHSGSSEVLEFVRAHERDWRWWENRDIQRPLLSIVAVRPEDQFEAARPERGVTIRVRCAFENTAQGLAKTAITELVNLSLDNQNVQPALVSTKAPRGQAFADHYHWHNVPNPTPGKHVATAVVREIDSKKEFSRSIEFLG